MFTNKIKLTILLINFDYFVILFVSFKFRNMQNKINKISKSNIQKYIQKKYVRNIFIYHKYIVFLKFIIFSRIYIYISKLKLLYFTTTI